ncbi:MAG: hypothetical protein AAGG09_21065 [Pseudomonadota bacterium]
MAPEATKRFIRGAIVGAVELQMPLPWERGARRARAAFRRGQKAVLRRA